MKFISDFLLIRLAAIGLIVGVTCGCAEIFGYDDEDDDSPTLTVKDGDGNSYGIVKIGTQTWMSKNLATTKFNDGTSITHVQGGTEWTQQTSPAYSWYENKRETYGNVYGAMYNAYAVKTGKLCPAGWHVPSEDEWRTLINYLGGASVAGGKLKEAGLSHWQSPNTGATNESGFGALPGGVRWNNTTGYSIGYIGHWWTTTVGNYPSFSRVATLYYNYSTIDFGGVDNGHGFSVRCLKN